MSSTTYQIKINWDGADQEEEVDNMLKQLIDLFDHTIYEAVVTVQTREVDEPTEDGDYAAHEYRV